MVPSEASRQGGAFTRRQALAAGIARGTICSRLSRGLWVQLLPRVYTAGPIGFVTRLHAAALWLPHGTVSHLAAAWLWGLLDEPDVVHLTVPLRCTRSSPHGWLRLVRRDIETGRQWELRGFRVVPPERAVLDCAAVLDRAAAARLFDRALGDRIGVPDLRERYWADLGCYGSRNAYHQLIAAVPGARSEPERVLAGAVRRAGLRGLRVNQSVMGFVTDLLDAELKLIVEVDGYRNHSDRNAFHRDRVRQNALVAAGYTVLRFTATQVMHDSPAVVAEIASVARRLASPPDLDHQDCRRSIPMRNPHRQSW
jgi:very-short-patch-repair endonuclease